MKKVSCGVLITNGIELLGCLPTGRTFRERNCLDLPKGHLEEGEALLGCALRELVEETGLVLKGHDLVCAGRFNYRPTKDLVLFVAQTDALPPLKSLHCDATFVDHQGNTIHEHSGYEYVTYADIKKRFFPALVPVISMALMEVNK